MVESNKIKKGPASDDDEKEVNKVVINVKEWTGGHRFTSGVSPIDKIHAG